MDATEPTAMTVAEMVAAFRARTLSPVEALEAVLARMDEVQPQLNAFRGQVSVEAELTDIRIADAVPAGGSR